MLRRSFRWASGRWLARPSCSSRCPGAWRSSAAGSRSIRRAGAYRNTNQISGRRLTRHIRMQLPLILARSCTVYVLSSQSSVISQYSCRPVYRKPSGQAGADWEKLDAASARSLTKAGVAVNKPVRMGGIIMGLTALAYLFIQVGTCNHEGHEMLHISLTTLSAFAPLFPPRTLILTWEVERVPRSPPLSWPRTSGTASWRARSRGPWPAYASASSPSSPTCATRSDHTMPCGPGVGGVLSEDYVGLWPFL